MRINKLVIIGVYLTYCDNSLVNQKELLDELVIIQFQIDKCKKEGLEFILIGVFNIDMNRKDKHFDIFDDFVYENRLIICDAVVAQQVNYTYRSYMGFSWIDHIAALVTNLNIRDCFIELSDTNMGDHLPIVCRYLLMAKTKFGMVFKNTNLKP